MNTYRITDTLAPAGETYLATVLGDNIWSVLNKAKKLWPNAGLLQVTLI